LTPKPSTTAPPRTRGRPRKFSAPARPVTLTLPDHVIDALARVDTDLGRAIVRLAQPVLRRQPHAPAELATFGRHSVIVVNPTRTLEKRIGVDLLHLPDGRALIAFDEPATIAGLELVLEDALEEPALPPMDRNVFEAIAGILKTARRSDRVMLLQKNIIVLETGRRAAHSKAPGRKRK
jgi:hypothetical protein